jgi:hypothetical protein
MTVNITSAASTRTRPISGHAYTLPVVRELPTKPADPAGAGGLW